MSNPIPRANHTVSAKLISGEEAEAIVAAVAAANPHALIENHGPYFSIHAEREIDFDLAGISEELGRPYDIPTLLGVLASYTGQVNVEDARVVVREAMTDSGSSR